MNLLDNYLYTGGDDRKIKVWDYKNKSFIIFYYKKVNLIEEF